MTGIRIILNFIVFGVLIVSCGKSELDLVLQDLDDTIASRNEYIQRLNDEIKLDRNRLYESSALNDKYLYADRLFVKFKAENADSAIFYANMSYKIASEMADDSLMLQSTLNRIQIPVNIDITHSRAIFESLDEKIIDERFGKKMLISYLYCGAELYKFLVNRQDSEDAFLNERYDYYRRRYCEENPNSIDAIRFKSSLMNNQGKYNESIDIVNEYMKDNVLDMYGYSILYNRLASTYELMGDALKSRIMYARSAMYNLMRPAKQYHSLTVLALQLLDDREYERALKYINIASSDAISSGYEFRISETSSYLLSINSLAEENKKTRNILLYTTFGLLLALLISAITVLIVLSKYSNRLKRSYDIISETNVQLADLNRIKENCLLKYMVNCTDYIKAIDDNNSNLKKVLKLGGLDAVKAELRKPKYSSKEFKRFYHEFDTNFLQMFPNFIEEVNKIMPEDHRFPPCNDGNLTMDLRIMAVIRIGIKSSGTIASFLNYAPSTVYTSRTKVKKVSLLKGEDFDSYIEKIGI